MEAKKLSNYLLLDVRLRRPTISGRALREGYMLRLAAYGAAQYGFATLAPLTVN
jgi:hypothetical protein